MVVALTVKPVKKGSYPLRPGVEGFFITCDGGREYQASNEAINVIDSYFEELVEGTESKVEQAELSKKPLNKITKFASSDSSSSDNDDDEDPNHGDAAKDNDEQTRESENKNVIATSGDASDKSGLETKDDLSLEKQKQEKEEKPENHDKQEAEVVEPPVKRQCMEAPKCGNLSKKVEDKSVDKLIEAELAELGDKSKARLRRKALVPAPHSLPGVVFYSGARLDLKVYRRFCKLDTGCNGVVFIQMRKKDGDPSPKDIVQHMMTSLASTKKHVSRFLLRVLPVEASCYTSEEEIKRAIKPLIDEHFPVETLVPRKFAVLYDARANTGVDRMKVIDAVAKCVPSSHKVDLANPDINIVVQIVKTVCLIGVVEKYKELAKYNLRQLSSSSKQ
ncbi:hypothetical protein DH2020_020892 [Rehmannia glutinosa]|uniref:THUMP domain-containing protein n=1 Tax=Rehmannia glutinosa TaxID=99300 RepID=A0ABR0WCP5_REHGL